MSGPDFYFETTLLDTGITLIAGIDEAGRGPLAGPVVAAAVILDPARIPAGLNDSKKLSAKRRDVLFEVILANAHVGIASIPAQEIDRINILQSTFQAMRGALTALPVLPDFALIDGRDVPTGLVCPAQAVIGGDARSLSIAAASIIAKVTRDRMMNQAGQDYPVYGFAGHKGYGAAKHITAIQAHGDCPLHRMTFGTLKKYNEK